MSVRRQESLWIHLISFAKILIIIKKKTNPNNTRLDISAYF